MMPINLPQLKDTTGQESSFRAMMIYGWNAISNNLTKVVVRHIQFNQFISKHTT